MFPFSPRIEQGVEVGDSTANGFLLKTEARAGGLKLLAWRLLPDAGRLGSDDFRTVAGGGSLRVVLGIPGPCF